MKIEEIENYVEATESLNGYLNDLSNVYAELEAITKESYSKSVLEEKYLSALNIYNNARGVLGQKVNAITHETFNRSPYMSLAITREGVFSAIGDFFKKIWEWIKKILKSIKEFFFGSAEEKAEEAKEEAKDVKDLIEKLRNRNLKDRELILKDLEKDNLLIRDGKSYGALGIMFKRAQYNIGYKDVADDVRKFLENMEGYFNYIKKENFNILNSKENDERLFGANVIRTTAYAHNLYTNYNEKIKDFGLYQKFDKFKDCLEMDFTNDPAIGELEREFTVVVPGDDDKETVTMAKNVRVHLAYLNERVAWKIYTMDDTGEFKRFEKYVTEKLLRDGDLSSKIDGASDNGVETVLKNITMILSYINRNLLVPVTGYKLKDKELDALRSYVTNKDNILNFLKIYSDFLNTIDVSSYKDVSNKIDKIAKDVDNAMDALLKKHKDKDSSKLIRAFSSTATNNHRSYSYFKEMASFIKTKIADLSRFSLLLSKEIEIFSSELKFDNIAKLITSLFKEESSEGEKKDDVSSESFQRVKSAPKLSFGLFRETKIEDEDPKPKRTTLVFSRVEGEENKKDLP